MALPISNSTTNNAESALGMSITPNNFAAIIGSNLINKYSFYAPGLLSVDGVGDVVWTAPTAGYKLGDFRLYNHTANTPIAQTDYTQNWSPYSGTVTFWMSCFLYEMNIKAFALPGDYLTIKFYTTESARAADGYAIKTVTTPIVYNAITPLTGHTRNVSYQAVSTQYFEIVDFPTTGLSADTPIYADTYISDVAGNRKINLGTRTRGYTTISFHRYAEPYAWGKNMNIPTPPSGYTVIFPVLYHAGSPVCSATSQVQQAVSFGTNYMFYVFAKGIYGSHQRIVALTSTDIILTYKGIRTTLATGVALSHLTGYYCAGTLGGGVSWSYDTAGDVTFENAVIAAVPSYTECT